MSSAAPCVGATEPVRPTVSDRLTRLGVTALGLLPPPVLRRLAGRPVIIDGQTLEPEVQVALKVLGAVPGESFEHLPVDEGRRQIDVEAWQFGGTPEPVAEVRDLVIPGAEGPIPARLYLPQLPDGAPPPPLMVNYHGGGFVLGSIASHEPFSRFLANHAGVGVLTVGYRLAPEHPFPAGHEDAIAAYAWACTHGNELGVSEAVGVIGDSAGGNLAASVALAARDRDLQLPTVQVLLSPWLDLASTRPSRSLFGEGYFLTSRQLDWYCEKLLPSPELARDPRVSPLHAEDLAGLPPAIIAYAGFDPLRDESAAYAVRLREAGGTVEELVQPGHVHPFTNVLGVGRTGTRATLEIAARVRDIMHPALRG